MESKKFQKQNNKCTKHKKLAKKSTSGITLVALVVTIIVLLILAGISINLVLGENGIIAKATQAKEVYEKSKALEELKLELLGNEIDRIVSGDDNEDIIERLNVKGIEKVEIDSESNEEIIYYITEKDSKYYRTVVKNENVLSTEKVSGLTDASVFLLKYFQNDSEISEIEMLINSNMGLAIEFIYKSENYCLYGEINEDKQVMYAEKIKGIEKVEEKGQGPVFYIIEEKENAYYRKIASKEGMTTEKINEFNKVDEAEAFNAFVTQVIFGSDIDMGVTMISETKFEYKDIMYKICEKVENETYVLYAEKYELIPIKMIVNSGDDGIVVLPVDVNEVTSIDWGDGVTTATQKNKNETTRNIKIASTNGIQLAGAMAGEEIAPYHQYQEKNKEYEVIIKGKITIIDSLLYSSYYDDMDSKVNYWDEGIKKIIEITQWGNTGLEKIHLSSCTNLRKIATSNEDSFINITNFDSSFNGCTSLIEIPSDLFANCTNVTSFKTTFAYCTGITEIPSDLFTNCPNVTNFVRTFDGCTNLSGNAPELWNLGTNSDANDYKGSPNGFYCFEGCNGLTNYEDIPDYWK